MPPAVKGVNSAISATIPDSVQRRRNRAEGAGHRTTPSGKRCVFLEQMLVTWATQSARARETAVTWIAPTAVSTETQNATCHSEEQGWKQKDVCGSQVPEGAARRQVQRCAQVAPGVWGSPGSSSPAPCLPTPGPLRGRALGPERVFPKRPGLGHLGCRPGGAGRGGRGGGRGKQYLPRPGNEPHRGLGDRAPVAPRGWVPDGRPPGGDPDCHHPARAPWVALQEGGPASPLVHAGSGSGSGPGPVGEPGPRPSSLAASSRPRDPAPATRAAPLLD